MKNRTIIFFFLVIFLALSHSNCQWPLEEENLIFLGDWSSSRYYLEIGANGRGYLQRRNRDGEEGRIIITNRKLKFRSDEFGKTFRINQEPAIDLESGRVFMVLDRRTFWRH